MSVVRLTTDIAVIGGGASALALAAMLKGVNVTLLERGARAGKKLLATGNGKCNLTAVGVDGDGYNRPEAVAPFLLRFPPEKTVSFFRGLGLEQRVISGRVYPYSECASSVLDVLMAAAEENGAVIRTGHEVRSVTRAKDGFVTEGVLLSDKGVEEGRFCVTSRAVVLATGSDATSGKDSLSLYVGLGHASRPFRPSLTPLLTDRESVKGLNGIRVKCRAELNGTTVTGEILFRDYGLSGIAALDLSSVYARGRARKGDTIHLDLAPDITEDALAERLGAHPDRSAERTLRGMFHSRVAERIAYRAGQRLDLPADGRALAAVIKDYTVTLHGTADASQAQVMSGGLRTEEFDNCLRSLRTPGAYAVGEALDVDGICGGYNLQWAWAAAYAAACGIAEDFPSATLTV